MFNFSVTVIRAATLGVIFGVGVVATGSEWRPLFDGSSLSGWKRWLGTPSATSDFKGLPRGADRKYQSPLGWENDPHQVIDLATVDGRPAIRMSGEVFGVLTTTESLHNYHLRLQFKWGERKWSPRENRPRDSGVLYHIHSEPGVSWGVWPASHELQLQEHDCGDLYTLKTQIKVRARRSPAPEGTPGAPTGFYTYDPAGESFTFEEDTPVNNRCIKSTDYEHPHGEWNTVELICLGTDSIYVINGQVVMRLQEGRKRGADGNWIALGEGQIALQSEGAEVFFRNVEVRSINRIPAEYAEAK